MRDRPRAGLQAPGDHSACRPTETATPGREGHRAYAPGLARRDPISVELHTELVSRLRAQAVESNVSEGEIVGHPLRVAEPHALIAQIPAPQRR
jgi:hypothetical protein